MKLLIIDKDYKINKLFDSKNILFKNEKYLLINLSINKLVLPEWLNCKNLDISNIIFSEYNKNKKFLKKKFTANLSKNIELVEYKLSEINYADNLWNIYFTSRAIKSIVKRKKIKKIILISNKKNTFFSLALKRRITKNLHHIYYYNNFYFNFKNILKSYYIFFSNFYNELLPSFFLFFFIKKKNHNKAKYLYANFPNHWNIKKKYYKILENKKKNVYLISVLRNNSNLLNQFKNLFLLKSINLKNYTILESYNNPIEILKIYLKNFFSFNKKNSIKLLQDLKLDFFSGEVERNYRLIEKSKNKSFYSSLKNFYKFKKFKHLIFPFFEFIDGRLISKFCNKNNVNTYGFQHAYLSENTYSRFFDAPNIIYQSNLMNYLPKNIFTESIFAKENLSKLSLVKVQCYGSYRLKNIVKFIKNKKSSNILLIMDLHNKKYLENVIANLSKKNLPKLYVRPHPVYYNEYKNKKFKDINIDFNKNIFKSLKTFKVKFVIISSSTSTFIDLIKTDLNIIIYKIPNFIRNDKILDKYFFTINNINKLNNLKYNNKMKISNYKNKFLPPKIKTNFLKKI